MAAKCYLALAGIFTQFSSLHALEALDEAAMSAVTGQAQGIRLTSEFDNSIKSVSYYDDDGYAYGGNGQVGVVSLSPVRVSTPTNRPLVVELRVDEKNGRNGLFFENRDLPIDIEVGSIAVNGKSLGGFGQNNFQIKNNLNANPADDQVFSVDLYAGGREGNGMTFDMDIPNSMSFDTYYDDDGTRLKSTVDFGNPFDSSSGGLKMTGLTLDLDKDGLDIGLPTITNGSINVYNATIGDEVLNSVAYRNINLKGGRVLLKNAEEDGNIGLEVDLTLSAQSSDSSDTGRTSLDYVYIAGAVDDNYLSGSPSSEIYEGSAKFTLLDDVSITGMRLNVDQQRGLVLDFDSATSSDGIRAHLEVSDIKFQRADRAAAGIAAPSIGTIDAKVHLTNNTYLQVEGH